MLTVGIIKQQGSQSYHLLGSVSTRSLLLLGLNSSLRRSPLYLLSDTQSMDMIEETFYCPGLTVNLVNAR